MKRNIFRLLMAAVLLLMLGFVVISQPNGSVIFGADKKPDPFAKVDKQKVDAAISKGLDFLMTLLKQKMLQPFQVKPVNIELTYDELVLYTLIKGGASTKEENFTALLEKVLAKKLEHTYQVSFMAMALAELDSEKYKAQLAECGQFLIDNQSKNGQWDYGQPVDPLNIKITPSNSDSGGGNETKAVKKVTLRKRKEGRPTGDNSNTQYGCLGLRACMQSGIIIPTDTFTATQQWLEKDQERDGGWDYTLPGHTSYGSMTVGALSSLIICKYYQTRQVPTNDPKVQNGLQWLIKNFTVTENPKRVQAPKWLYYYLYALERLGAFLETEKFGNNEWYPTGANFILDQQQPNGSWSAEDPCGDTCFAILFLRRATKPLRAVVTPEK